MEPFREDPAETAAGELPKPVKTARTIMWVQLAMVPIGFILAIIFIANNRDEIEEARQEGERAGGGAALFGLIGLVALVLLIVCAVQLPKLKSSTRTMTFAVEGWYVLGGLIGLASGQVFGIVNVGLAGAVIYLLTRPEAKAAFSSVGADASRMGGRVDIRDAKRPGDFG